MGLVWGGVVACVGHADWNSQEGLWTEELTTMTELCSRLRLPQGITPRCRHRSLLSLQLLQEEGGTGVKALV